MGNIDKVKKRVEITLREVYKAERKGFSMDDAIYSAIHNIFQHDLKDMIHLDDKIEGVTVTEDCDGFEGCATECGTCLEKEREGRPDMVLREVKVHGASIRELLPIVLKQNLNVNVVDEEDIKYEERY